MDRVRVGIPESSGHSLAGMMIRRKGRLRTRDLQEVGCGPKNRDEHPLTPGARGPAGGHAESVPTPPR